jgi:ElaB/YqjD/DUF883 family membrane-anchored ribosome-binding protein
MDQSEGEMAVSDYVSNGGKVTLDRLREGRKYSLDAAHDAISEAAERLMDASERASLIARQFSDRAAQAYGQARVTAREVDSNLQPFIKERPYVALALAVGVGFLLARTFMSGGPKVIYVEQPPESSPH